MDIQDMINVVEQYLEEAGFDNVKEKYLNTKGEEEIKVLYEAIKNGQNLN
jgi:hypothetical protein